MTVANTAFLIRGPCDGKSVPVTAGDAASRRLTCKGATYALRLNDYKGADAAEWLGTYVKPTTSAPHVTHAWTRLMRALGHHGPKQLKRVHNSTVHIRRMTRHHR